MSLLPIKYSDIPGRSPSLLLIGELAVNIADGNLYYGSKNGVRLFSFSGSSSTNTGSLLLTASVNLNTITFTKGNGSTFAITVDTGSGSPGSGTVTSIATAGLISGGTITTTGTISTSMNTNRLVGRSTAGVGIMEEITIGSGLSLSGGTLSATGGGGTFPFNGSAVITGSLLVSGSGITVTGSLNVTQGITGSLFGTSSWANNATTASFVQTAQTASYVTSSNVFGPYGADSILSASFALTASYILPSSIPPSSFIATGSVTASTNVGTGNVFTVTSASVTEFAVAGTGVTIGNVITDTHTVTGSLNISGSTVITGSLRVRDGITGSLFGTASWALNAITSSYPIRVTGSTIYSTGPVSTTVFNSTNTQNNIFLGSGAGQNATNVQKSIFLGLNAGRSTTTAGSSVFLGDSAGDNATSANISVFLGASAGYFATNANTSLFIGSFAGSGATNAAQSVFMGGFAGLSATNARRSIFLGSSAGQEATNASSSIFVGNDAGYQATNADYSILIGYQVGKVLPTYVVNPTVYEAISTITSFDYDEASAIQVISATTQSIVVSGQYDGNTQPFTLTTFAITGPTYTISVNFNYYTAPVISSITYNAGLDQSTFNFASPYLLEQYNEVNVEYRGVGSNNIIIGNNITLPDYREDSINLGGILFGTGSYSTLTGNPFSGSAGGRIGINVVNPTQNFEVSGTVAFPSLTTSPQLNVLTIDTASGQLYYTASSAIGGGGSGTPGGTDQTIQFNSASVFSGSLQPI